METQGVYLQNSETCPVAYGQVKLINPYRQSIRGESEKKGLVALPVIVGFCGTDYELMKMGKELNLSHKFPLGENRLINGHEGVVWVPEQNRFAIVLIRGGDSCDPTRFTEGESYFEYGCDGADGLFCDKNYFNPDMLLPLPEPYCDLKKITLSLAKKLVFADPYACAVFQHERMCDIGVAQNYRVEMAKHRCDENLARKLAVDSTFERIVIFGLGTTGLFIGDQIRRNHPDAKILFVGRSSADSQKVSVAIGTVQAEYLSCDGLTEVQIAKAITKKLGGKASVFVGASGTGVEHRIAFQHEVLGCNGIYNSFSLGPDITFKTMPFGFKNHVILSSINFTKKHMESAIKILCDSEFDKLVELIDKKSFITDPIAKFENVIFAKGAPLKTAVVWNDGLISAEERK